MDLAASGRAILDRSKLKILKAGTSQRIIKQRN